MQPLDDASRSRGMLREEREPIDRNSGELLTIDELAAHLKVAKSWIYTHTHARTKPRLPSIKLGKYLRFRLPEVYAYLETLRRV